jgi:hypothetical protein
VGKAACHGDDEAMGEFSDLDESLASAKTRMSTADRR